MKIASLLSAALITLPLALFAAPNPFDDVNHIRRAKCPVEITRAGLGDYTCPPSGLALYYNAVPGKKSISWVQGSEHGFIPPGENQVAVLGNFKPTGGESKSQNASSSVK